MHEKYNFPHLYGSRIGLTYLAQFNSGRRTAIHDITRNCPSPYHRSATATGVRLDNKINNCCHPIRHIYYRKNIVISCFYFITQTILKLMTQSDFNDKTNEKRGWVRAQVKPSEKCTSPNTHVNVKYTPHTVNVCTPKLLFKGLIVCLGTITFLMRL